MRLKRFDLNLLLALDALLREKNVTRAAERCFLSQPAMSAALGKLRDYFSDPLLVRIGRELELTPRGRSLVGPVQQMLLDTQTVLGTQAVFDPSIDRRAFTAIGSDLVTPWLMPRVLRRLVEQAPGIRVQLDRPTPGNMMRLAQGEVHLLATLDAPDYLPLPGLSDSVRTVVVGQVRWACLARAGHPDSQTALTVEQLLAAPHIVVRDNVGASLLETTVRKRYQNELDVRVVTPSAFHIPHLVATTPFLCVMPLQLARLFGTHPGLQTLELPEGFMPASRLNLMWHRSHEPDAGHAWFRTQIANTASEATAAAEPLSNPERSMSRRRPSGHHAKRSTAVPGVKRRMSAGPR